MTTGGTPFTAAPVVVLLGPPGAGKRTQARRLEEAFGFVRLPARASADVAETAEGENVLAALATGLSSNGPARGVVIEGFPGTAAEAEALDRLLSLSGRAVVAAVAFDVDDVKVIHRVAGRYSCADCGAGYHDDFRPTATSGVCDACGGGRRSGVPMTGPPQRWRGLMHIMPGPRRSSNTTTGDRF